jgi:tellurite resistance protein TehA-like permease
LPSAPSSSIEVYVLAAAITGGVGFVSGPIGALALADVLNPQLALTLWVGAIIGVFGFAAHGRPPRRVAIGGALLLPMGFVLCILAMIFGGGDGPHFVFWLWVLGSATLALALRRLGTAVEPTEQQRVRRRIIWGVAALASLVAVFPPLRDSLFRRGETATLEEGAPTPRALDDD